MTACGETSERVAAAVHAALVLLYAAAIVFHTKSVFVHLWRVR